MTAHLIRDDPAWTYLAPTGLCQRRLRVWHLTEAHPGDRRGPRHLVAVITEAGPGMTITNAAEMVAKALRDAYPDDHIETYEHWPADTGADPTEHYDLVEVTPGRRPDWYRTDPALLANRLPGLTP